MNTMQTETALAAAFVSAGYQDPLAALLREAWRVSPRSSEGRLAYVQRGMRERPALLWVLLEQQGALATVRTCTENALADARESAAAARKDRSPETGADADGCQTVRDTHPPAASVGEQLPSSGQGGGGQTSGDTHVIAAPSLNELPPAATPDGNDGRGRKRRDAQSGSAPAVTSQFPHARPLVFPVRPHLRGVPKKTLKQMADDQAASMASKLHVEAKYCRLDTFLIDGQPIGDCAVADVRKWADARDKDRRVAMKDVLFARSLVSNLPGHATVREFWGAADADATYDRAVAAAEASDVAG